MQLAQALFILVNMLLIPLIVHGLYTQLRIHRNVRSFSRSLPASPRASSALTTLPLTHRL